MKKDKTSRSNIELLPIEIVFGGAFLSVLVVLIFVILMFLSINSAGN